MTKQGLLLKALCLSVFMTILLFMWQDAALSLIGMILIDIPIDYCYISCPSTEMILLHGQ